MRTFAESSPGRLQANEKDAEQGREVLLSGMALLKWQALPARSSAPAEGGGKNAASTAQAYSSTPVCTTRASASQDLLSRWLASHWRLPHATTKDPDVGPAGKTGRHCTGILWELLPCLRTFLYKIDSKADLSPLYLCLKIVWLPPLE